ncbi:CCA tRNA nucleotidyltransferase [Amycolatopsis pigmentata]|uniref:CCA tRNA nucleotidyltransferase n=1 Tax=Amycolatopsis pigmentata TaxID=450801 RepID=A0ABW5FT05_9PSEU
MNELAAKRNAVTELMRISPVADDLAGLFARAGHRLYLVGGSVRDAMLGRSSPDLDFTTDARPGEVLKIVSGWADGVWETGIEFGTVGVTKRGATLEITTFRADTYDRVSRNPEVTFGDTIEGDLSRRDFTVNAMAIEVSTKQFVDPFDGLAAVRDGILDTPATPQESFADDPLRMLRAARFVSQLGFTPAPRVVAAMTEMAGELARITAERVQAELSKLILGSRPRQGLELMVDTGLADVVLPEVPGMRLAIDEHHQHKDVYQHSLTVLDQAIALEKADGWEPDLVLRLAALLHDIGKPDTRRFTSGGGVSFHHHEVVGAKMVRKRLRALKYPKQVIEDIGQLVFLHLRFHGYGRGEWTDSAVRRYVTDAGDLLPRLHKLVRADCTTRNKRKAAALQRTYDDLEERIARLEAQEDLARVRPDLDGNEIMKLLGLPPGPLVGQAWRHLKELRLDRGPLTHEEAVAELVRWARENGIEPPE